MPEFAENVVYEEEKVRDRDGTSTIPESLKNHHGWGSDRAANGLVESASNDNEMWARQ